MQSPIVYDHIPEYVWGKVEGSSSVSELILFQIASYLLRWMCCFVIRVGTSATMIVQDSIGRTDTVSGTTPGLQTGLNTFGSSLFIGKCYVPNDTIQCHPQFSILS